MKIIYQEKENDCGLACCTMIINHFHIENLTLSDIEKDFPVINSLNISSIEDILYKHNIESESYEVDFDNLIKRKSKHPFIAMIKNENQTHFVIVKEIHKDIFIIFDPAVGKRELSFEEFRSLFLNIVIIPKKPKLILNFKNKKLYVENYSFIFKVILLEFLIFLTMTISIGYLRVILDIFIKEQDLFQLIAITLWFFFISAIRYLFVYILNLIKTKEVKKVYSSFSQRIISEIFNKDKSFFNENTRAKFLTLDEHIMKTSYFSVNYFATIITGFMFLSFSVCFFWLLDYRFVLIWLCISLIHLSVSILIKNKYKKNIKGFKKSYYTYKQNLLNSYDLAKNNSGKLKFEKVLNHTMEAKKGYFKHLKKHTLLEKDSHLISGSLEFIFSQIYAIVGVILIWKGYATIGIVIFVLSFHSHINHQIENMFHFYTLLPEYRNSESVIKNFLFVKNNMMDNGYIPEKQIKVIRVKRLFCEKNDKVILKNVNMRLVPWTIINGPTGVGKSTLLDCVSKKLNFWNGEILYDEIPLKELDGEYVREKIIQTNNFLPLLEMTVSDYIGPNSKNKRIKKILRSYKIGLDRYLNSGFSSGQQEIINFLHTISAGADIYFMDEALSHVDKKKRSELYTLAKEILSDKFVVCVSHDKDIIPIFKKAVKL